MFLKEHAEEGPPACDVSHLTTFHSSLSLSIHTKMPSLQSALILFVFEVRRGCKLIFH